MLKNVKECQKMSEIVEVKPGGEGPPVAQQLIGSSPTLLRKSTAREGRGIANDLSQAKVFKNKLHYAQQYRYILTPPLCKLFFLSTEFLRLIHYLMGVGIFSAQYLALIHEGIAPGPASPLLVRADWSGLMHAILAPHNFIPNFVC